MKCYLINLDRSVARRAAMVRLFAQFDVSFERFSAIDGDRLSEHDLRAATTTRPDYRPLTATEIGCFLSHRACWERIAAGADTFAAIFEDDVEFSPNAAAYLKDDGWIPRDADLVKLEAFDQPVWIDRTLRAVSAGQSVARLRSTHWGTAGYLVRRDRARRLLEATARFSVTVDEALFDPRFSVLSRSVIYQFVPALCTQQRFVARETLHPAFDSTVETLAGTLEYPEMGPSKLRRELRRVKDQCSRILRWQVRRRIPFTPAQDAASV